LFLDEALKSILIFLLHLSGKRLGLISLFLTTKNVNKIFIFEYPSLDMCNQTIDSNLPRDEHLKIDLFANYSFKSSK